MDGLSGNIFALEVTILNFASNIGALSVFYAMLGATLLVPIVVAIGGRAGGGAQRRAVLVSIVAGALAVVAMQLLVGNRPGSLLTPATVGLAAAAGAYALARASRL